MRSRLLRQVHGLGLGRFIGRVLLAVFGLRLSTPAEPGGRPSGHDRIDVYTFVTDDAEYAAMRDSLAKLGERATFTRLTDHANDPFTAINQIAAGDGASIAMLCHQDVRFINADRLFDRLAELDSGWAIAGVAGASQNLQIVRCVTDGHGGHSAHRLPAAVMSLDECVLIFNRQHPPRASSQLHGFHFYGTDVCLHALADGRSAWVIDLPVVHGDCGPVRRDYEEDYARVRREFVNVWQRQFRGRYVGTPNEALFLSRHPLLSRLLGSSRALGWVTADRDRTNRAWLTPSPPAG